MQFSPLTIRRRYILGNLTDKCGVVNEVPIYLNEITESPVGYVNELPERYKDAFLFHLPEDICKRLASNGYNLDLDYDFCEQEAKSKNNKQIRLNHIILTSRASSVIPRRHALVKGSD